MIPQNMGLSESHLVGLYSGIEDAHVELKSDEVSALQQAAL